MGLGDEKLTVGQRLVRAVKERVPYGKVKQELERLQIPQSSFTHWKDGDRNPQVYYLTQMALAGYDVYWILTGKRQIPVQDIDFDIAEYEEEL